jgi:hypothetical protein
MTKIEEFVHDDCPSRQDEHVAVWRAQLNPRLSVAVIQYSGENTFTARAMYTSVDDSRAVTTDRHRNRREAAKDAMRLLRTLNLAVLCEKNLI